ATALGGLDVLDLLGHGQVLADVLLDQPLAVLGRELGVVAGLGDGRAVGIRVVLLLDLERVVGLLVGGLGQAGQARAQAHALGRLAGLLGLGRGFRGGVGDGVCEGAGGGGFGRRGGGLDRGGLGDGGGRVRRRLGGGGGLDGGGAGRGGGGRSLAL